MLHLFTKPRIGSALIVESIRGRWQDPSPALLVHRSCPPHDARLPLALLADQRYPVSGLPATFSASAARMNTSTGAMLKLQW